MQVSLILFASLPSMVRLHATSMTEIILASLTPYPILAHMYAGGGRHDITSVVFGIVVDLTLRDLHDVAAGTFGNISGGCKHLVKLDFFDSLFFFLGHVVFHFFLLDWFATLWASQDSVVG